MGSQNKDQLRACATHFPGNSKFFIHSLRGKEPVDILLQTLLKVVLKDDILPVCLLNFHPKAVIFVPEPLVKYPNFIM